MASDDSGITTNGVRASAKADCQLLTAESLRQCFGCGYAALWKKGENFDPKKLKSQTA
jgi:hypothetical protein